VRVIAARPVGFLALSGRIPTARTSYRGEAGPREHRSLPSFHHRVRCGAGRGAVHQPPQVPRALLYSRPPSPSPSPPAPLQESRQLLFKREGAETIKRILARQDDRSALRWRLYHLVRVRVERLLEMQLGSSALTGPHVDVRDSTLKSLKLTCPSAEGIQEPPSPSTSDDSPDMERQAYPFPDMGDEWSDEEVLIPRQRRKPQFIPPLNFEKITALSGETSSAGSTSTSPSPNRMGVKASPLVPPKSPSRPDASRGNSQDDLIQRFYQVTKERDALRKELQRRSVGVSGMPARGSMVARSEENALIEELQALRYEIRVWSEEYFSGPLKTSSKRPHLHRASDLFANLTDNYQTYLKHPEERPLLIQAYVWMKLQQKIFNNWNKGSGYVWAGKLGDKKLRDINDTLRKGKQQSSVSFFFLSCPCTTLTVHSCSERSPGRGVPPLALHDRKPPRSPSRR